MTGDGLRSRYETAVLALREQVAAMRGEGASAETIARAVHAERRRLAARFKEQTPEPVRSQIAQRTLTVYGDAIGPTIEWLRARGKSWDGIIDSATRPGPLPSLGDASRLEKGVHRLGPGHDAHGDLSRLSESSSEPHGSAGAPILSRVSTTPSKGAAPLSFTRSKFARGS